MKRDPTVFVVDDDPGMRQSLAQLVESVSLPVETYSSAQDFLDAYDPERPGCLVLDVRMPGISGLDLQDRLAAEDVPIPVIIISGHGDVRMVARAVKKGAVDFLEKPFSPQELLDRISEAVTVDARIRQERTQRAGIAARLAPLSRREREVMDVLVAGKTVKGIAAQLGLSHKTVQVHRTHIMEKTQANSLAELVRLALANGVDQHNSDLHKT